MQVHKHLIPTTSDHAVGVGWGSVKKPLGVTWHWTAGNTLAGCRATLGGATPQRKGVASAHYAVGRSDAEGVDQYVTLDDRSWHAGKNQVLDVWGHESTVGSTGTRTTIGIETVHPGYVRVGVPVHPDCLEVASPDGKQILRVNPWPEEQIALCIEVGKEILAVYPHISQNGHHGHYDLCPGYKLDPLGFPFARVIRGIYGDPSVPDVWTPFLTVRGRQKALLQLGFYLGRTGADGVWGEYCDVALRTFQARAGIPVNGYWTLWVSRAVTARLA